MVIYFTKNGSTKKYATKLAEIKKDEIFEIKQEKPIEGNISLAIKSVFKKESKIAKIPDLSKESIIYICSPVWGGGFPPAMRYFVKNANLKGKTIKLLLTCMTPSNSYVANYEKQLSEVGATISKSLIFSSKKQPDPPIHELEAF